MDEIKIFENPEFGMVRTVEVNGEAYFVGKDIAEILGYSRPDHAIANHVGDEDKLMYQIDTSGQNRTMFIGLCSEIRRSKMRVILEYAVLIAILTAVLYYLYSYVAESEKEIAEEQAEKKYRKEIEAWRKTAQRPRVSVRVLDGDEITIEDRSWNYEHE